MEDRGKDQRTSRQSNRNHPIRITERKINRKNSRASEIYGMVTKGSSICVIRVQKERRNISRPKMYAKK